LAERSPEQFEIGWSWPSYWPVCGFLKEHIYKNISHTIEELRQKK
jgi:hypothetical protein